MLHVASDASDGSTTPLSDIASYMMAVAITLIPKLAEQRATFRCGARGTGVIITESPYIEEVIKQNGQFDSEFRPGVVCERKNIVCEDDIDKTEWHGVREGRSRSETPIK